MNASSCSNTSSLFLRSGCKIQALLKNDMLLYFYNFRTYTVPENALNIVYFIFKEKFSKFFSASLPFSRHTTTAFRDDAVVLFLLSKTFLRQTNLTRRTVKTCYKGACPNLSDRKMLNVTSNKNNNSKFKKMKGS